VRLQDPICGVVAARWHGRRVIAKCRAPHHAFRHRKEALWLARAHALGIPVPPVLAVEEGQRQLTLILPQAPRATGVWAPRDWIQRLKPLASLAPPDGWGSLRADGRPRWLTRQQALAWYQARAQSLLADPGAAHAQLAAYFTEAQAGVIHGDIHRGNRAGAWIIDWEQVAVADVWEDAARASLASPWPHRAWAQSLGTSGDNPRWQRVRLVAAIEAAGVRGPRQAGARCLLGLD
jgi:hypothetical protein